MVVCQEMAQLCHSILPKDGSEGNNFLRSMVKTNDKMSSVSSFAKDTATKLYIVAKEIISVAVPCLAGQNCRACKN